MKSTTLIVLAALLSSPALADESKARASWPSPPTPAPKETRAGWEETQKYASLYQGSAPAVGGGTLWAPTARKQPALDLRPELDRARMLRSAVDASCAQGRCELALDALKQLIPGASAAQLKPLLRALDAASRGDVATTLSEIDAFGTSPSARQEALILASRRAARSVVGPDVPLSPSAADPATLTVHPRRIQGAPIVYSTGIEGAVTLRALVLPTGEALVTGAMNSADPLLLDIAAEAVAASHFAPARVDDRVVAADHTMRMDFRSN